jgi:hypothetical protein
MARLALLVCAALVLAAMFGPSLALTAADCAKLENPTKKDECVRSLPAGQSGTQRATPADPSGPGPATRATPAVPGGGKGKGR